MEQKNIAVRRLRLEIYHVISHCKVINGDISKEEVQQEVQKLYELFFRDVDKKALSLSAGAQVDLTLDLPLRKFVQYLQYFVVFVASLCNEPHLNLLLSIDNTRELLNLIIPWLQRYESNGGQEILNIEEALFLSVETLLRESLQATLALVETYSSLNAGALWLFLDLLKLVKEISSMFKACFQHLNSTLLKKHTVLLWEEILPSIFLFQELSSFSTNKEISLALSSLNGELNTLLVWAFVTPRTVVDLFALKLSSKPSDVPQYQIDYLKTTNKLHLSANSKKEKVKRIAIESFIDVVTHYSLMNPLASTIKWEEKRKVLLNLYAVYVAESNKIRDVEDGHQDNQENQISVNGKKKRKFMEIMATELRSSRHNLARLFHYPLLLIDRLENRLLIYNQNQLFEENHGREESNIIEKLLHYLKLKVELVSFLRNQLEDRFISQQSLFQKYYQYLQQDFELVLDNLRHLSSIAATALASSSNLTTISFPFTLQTGTITILLNVTECIEVRILLIKYLQQLQSIRSNYSEKDLKQVLAIFFQDQTLILGSKNKETNETENSVLSFPLLSESELGRIQHSDKWDICIKYFATVIDFLLSIVELYSQLRDLPLLLGSMIHLARGFPITSMDVVLRSVIFKERLRRNLIAIPQGQWKTVLLNLLSLDTLAQEKSPARILDHSPMLSSESIQCSTTMMVIIEGILDASVESQFRELDHPLIDCLNRDILKLLLNLEQLLSFKISLEVKEDTLKLMIKALQFSSKYFHQTNALHRIVDDHKEVSLSLYSVVCERMIPRMRVIDQEIIVLYNQLSIMPTLPQVHSFINTVLQHKLSIFQFLINDYHAPQNAKNLIQEVKSSFCQLIHSVTSENVYHLILSIYSFLLQTIQLWWEFFASTNTVALLKEYPIFRLGLESFLQITGSTEKVKELNLSQMILELRNKFHIGVIQQRLNSSSISEFPVMQQLVITKINDLINNLPKQQENMISIQLLMQSLSNDFFQHLPHNLSQLLVEGAARIINYNLEFPSELADSLLFCYLYTLNRYLRNKLNRNNWATLENLHLIAQNPDHNLDLVQSMVPVLFELLLSKAHEMRVSVQTLQEIESLTHYAISLEAINSILTMAGSSSLPAPEDNFFEYPMLMLVRLLDVSQENRDGKIQEEYQPSFFYSFHSMMRILHFTGIKVMDALRAFVEQLHELDKAKVIMKIMNKHQHSFHSMRKLFARANSSASKTVIAAFMNKMMSWVESEYEILVRALQTSNRTLFKRLLRQTEDTKISPIRLVCSEIVLSVIIDDQTVRTDSSPLADAIGYLMNSSVINLILRLATEIDNYPTQGKGKENASEINEERMMSEKSGIILKLFEKFRAHLCCELQQLFNDNKDPLRALNIMVAHWESVGVAEQSLSSQTLLEEKICSYDLVMFLQRAAVLIKAIVSSARKQDNFLVTLEDTFATLQIHSSIFPHDVSQQQQMIINNLISFSIAQKALHHIYNERDRLERSEEGKRIEESYWRAIELLQTKTFLSAEVLVTALTVQPHYHIENENLSGQFSSNCLRKVISDSIILLKVILKPNSFQLQLESEQQQQQQQIASQSRRQQFFKQLSMKHVKLFADKSFQVLARVNTAIVIIIRQNFEEERNYPEYYRNSLIQDCMNLHYLQLEFLHHLIMLSSRSLIPNIFSKLSAIELVIIQTMRVFPFFFSSLEQPTVSALYGKAVELFNRIMQLISSVGEFEKQYFMILVGILHELKNPYYQHQQFFYGLFPLYGKLGKKDKNRVFHLLDSTGKEILNQLVAEYRRMYRYDDSSN